MSLQEWGVVVECALTIALIVCVAGAIWFVMWSAGKAWFATFNKLSEIRGELKRIADAMEKRKCFQYDDEDNAKDETPCSG